MFSKCAQSYDFCTMRDTVLTQLHAVQFKNHTQLDLEFSPTLNALVGNNGAGKTNVLDAIYYLCVTKSYFHPVDSHHIQHDAPFFVVEGLFNEEKASQRVKVRCALKRGGKKSFTVDDVAYDRLAEHIGRFPVVMISPSDRDLLSEGSEVRRKFMDSIIAQSNKEYLNHLLDYQKTVQQRNALLKYFAANRTFSSEQLSLYNERLCRLAPKIHTARKEFVSAFSPLLQRFYDLLSGGQESVDFLYSSGLEHHSMEELLRMHESRDRLTQYTTVGIHKDDLDFQLMGHPLKRVGSQGQQKSYLVALKLANFALLVETMGRKPLLLLDDVFDKLDAQRVEALVSLVQAHEFGQIFVSDTHPERTTDLVKRMDPNAAVFPL